MTCLLLIAVAVLSGCSSTGGGNKDVDQTSVRMEELRAKAETRHANLGRRQPLAALVGSADTIQTRFRGVHA
jgi:outer membrane murein-binding lipoprotein Lpp